MRIYCRVKPLSGTAKSTIEVPEQGDGATMLVVSGQGAAPRKYFFDAVFDGQATQSAVFEQLQSAVQGAFDGNATTLMAYGATGSGKTHTLQGSATDPGIIRRSLDYLREANEQMRELDGSAEVNCQCFEIYNDKVFDLMTASSNATINVEYRNGQVHMVGLSTTSVNRETNMTQLLESINERRRTGRTNLNAESSRSHCVFKVMMSRKGKQFGVLNLIDLAGNERWIGEDGQQSESGKKRQAESVYINKSLTSLGRVMRELRRQRERGGSVDNLPCRESKLTRVLQDSFNDNCQVIVMINVCQDEKWVTQTKDSLQFGALTVS